MTNNLDTTETLTARTVAELPQPTARAVSRQIDRPLQHSPSRKGAPKPPRPDDDDEDGFLQRFRVPIIIGLLLLGGAGYAIFGKPATAKPKAPPKAPPQQVVRIQPLPPPPPPPPKVQPPPPKQEEKKLDEAPMEKPEPKPEAAKPKPVDEPAPLGTGLVGKGPGMSGLGRSGNGGGGNGTGGGGGDMFAWYASQAVSPITSALRNNSRTRAASMSVVAHIWVDGSGKITRGQLMGSSGDPSVDEAIKNEVLPGVQLSEAPPAGMKMPIKLRLNARRQK